jgi:predicted transcriptional regulator
MQQWGYRLGSADQLIRPALDKDRPRPYAWSMEINLAPELQAKLTQLAADRGSDPGALVQEAIERMVDYDEWFLREVEKGITSADRGELIEHEDIGKLIDSRYRG